MGENSTFCKKKQYFYIETAPKRYAILALSVCCVYFLTMLIGVFNFLATVAPALALGLAFWLLLQAATKAKINLWLTLAYAVMLFGTIVFYLIWGADSFAHRLWYNVVIGLLAIFSFAGLFLVNKYARASLKYACTVTLCVLLIGASVAYFLLASLRVTPTVDRLYDGEKSYLDSVSSLKKDASSPNVLVILMDDMAYADLSSYSYLGSQNATIKTPNIDMLAEDGLLMDNFYASAPVCTPSRFSMLTGRYASRGYLDNVVFPSCVSTDPYGITHFVNPFQFSHNVEGILGDEITLAEALDSYGYDTGLIGKWNLGDYGEYLPTNQGFDYFFGSYYVNDMTPYNMVREVDGAAQEVYSHYDMLDQSATTSILTEELNGFINGSIANNNNFFAYYCTPWPHYPIFSGETGDTTDDSYIACIEEFDSSVGTIIQNLKDKGVYDDTLIIFTSDNGPGREGVTGALRGRKNTTFDGGQKVPLIATYVNGGLGSGIPVGDNGYRTVSSSAMNIDLFPTILQYVGIDALPEDRVIDGVSLKELWQGTDATLRVHDALYYIKKGKVQAIQAPVTYTSGDQTLTHDFKYYASVRTENSAFIDQVYKNYLFDLDLDPAEGYNVSMTYPEVAAALNARLQAFGKELKDNRRGIL